MYCEKATIFEKNPLHYFENKYSIVPTKPAVAKNLLLEKLNELFLCTMYGFY